MDLAIILRPVSSICSGAARGLGFLEPAWDRWMMDGPELAWPWVLVPSPCGRVFVCVCGVGWGGGEVRCGWLEAGVPAGPSLTLLC